MLRNTSVANSTAVRFLFYPQNYRSKSIPCFLEMSLVVALKETRFFFSKERTMAKGGKYDHLYLQ